MTVLNRGITVPQSRINSGALDSRDGTHRFSLPFTGLKKIRKRLEICTHELLITQNNKQFIYDFF